MKWSFQNLLHAHGDHLRPILHGQCGFGSSQIERNSYLYDMVKILSDECIISLICARYGWDMSDNGHIWSRYLWYEWDLFNSIHILVVSLWYGLNIAIFGWDILHIVATHWYETDMGRYGWSLFDLTHNLTYIVHI